MHVSSLLTSLTSRTLTDCPPSRHGGCTVHRSNSSGAGRWWAGDGGWPQWDLSSERGRRGPGPDQYPEFPAAQRLLLLLVLLLQLFMERRGETEEEKKEENITGHQDGNQAGTLSQTLGGGDPDLVSVVRQADEKPRGSERFQGVPANRVQRGEHAVLAGLWRPQTRKQQECHRGKSSLHLRGLHFYIIAKRGQSGCPGSGGDKQEDAGPHASHVRRRPAADLHADAQGLLPKVPLLLYLQEPGSGRVPHLLGVLVPLRLHAAWYSSDTSVPPSLAALSPQLPSFILRIIAKSFFSFTPLA